MTKRELIESLAGFRDDQEVYIRLHSKDYPLDIQVPIESIDLESVTPEKNVKISVLPATGRGNLKSSEDLISFQ